MRQILSFLLTIVLCPFLLGQNFDASQYQKKEGFFPIYYADGKVMLEITHMDEEFLYVPFLAEGLGSNDIGLDRGQTGRERIVKFTEEGGKILLIEPNLDYRAVSNDPLERKSVEQAFAKSVLFGFDKKGTINNRPIIDLTGFLLRDEHGVSNRLKRADQGALSLDKSRSVVMGSGLHAFPDNVEMDALLTFSGDGKGRWLGSVAPNSDHVSVVQHHSFVKLPDSGYEPRIYDARSGYYPFSYADYASPIQEDMVKRFISRHRLEKKDPSALLSEAVEPIVYYVDAGCPEPIRSALIEGASWWNQAFEAAGYKDAFQVKVLPADASPLDVRYNVIQWVHRSTRGWSYGASVVDPRTGEIIKGHVSLGSLRVRQDFMIAQGLAADYSQGNDVDQPMMDMALARLRQLSAHEVGHTLGLMHNFSASTYNRASVMDYPHPQYTWNDQTNSAEFDDAYAVGIGDWDKRTILYGYQDFPPNQNEKDALLSILEQNQDENYYYLSDSDARPAYGVSARSHLWDNGTAIADELLRMNDIRRKAMTSFGPRRIQPNASLAKLTDVFTPLYLSTRYQAEAATKIIGGIYYEFSANNMNSEPKWNWVSPADQKKTLQALTQVLAPENLVIDSEIWHLLPPRAPGYSNDRENFDSQIKPMFDPLYAAKSYAEPIIDLLLNPHRLNRLQLQEADNRGAPTVDDLVMTIHRSIGSQGSGLTGQISAQNEMLLLNAIFRALNSDVLYPTTAENLFQSLMVINDSSEDFMQVQIKRYLDDPSEYEIPSTATVPDGSPIGCGGYH